MRSRWDGSMLACTLNTNPENGASSGRGRPSTSGRATGRGTRSMTASSSLRTPKLVSAEPKNMGVDSRAEEQLHVDVGAHLVEQGRARPGPPPTPRPSSAAACSGGTTSSGASVAPRAARVKRVKSAVTAIDDPAEVAGDADRPGDRRDDEPDLLLDLVEQLERVASRPVPLVDEGEQRQLALAAHLEELEGLRLDALGRVEHHDRGVGGGQHPVGVLGEVAVTGGVEQVDDAVAVRELQHRRGDGDAALLLERHPVRGGRSTVADRAFTAPASASRAPP